MKFKDMTDDEREYFSACAHVEAVRNWLRDGKVPGMADRLDNVLGYMRLQYEKHTPDRRKHKHVRPVRKRQARAASLTRV